MRNRRSAIIILSLFLYGVIAFASFLHKHEPSLSILVSEHAGGIKKNTPMFAGNVIQFELAALHDGLGIVAVRFNTYGKINDDVITFRIKPKDAQDWVYANNYKTDQFQNHELFPFGFPLNPTSKNKIYTVQLESLSGTDNNHVSIDTINPVIVGKYRFPPTNQTPSKSMKVQFGVWKMLNLLTNYSTAFPLVFYFSPLVLYLLNSVRSILVPAFLLLSAYFLNLQIPVYLEFTLFLVWLTYILANKMSNRVSVILSLLAAIYLIIQALKNDISGVDQAGLWLYYCLLLTIIQIKVRNF